MKRIIRAERNSWRMGKLTSSLCISAVRGYMLSVGVTLSFCLCVHLKTNNTTLHSFNCRQQPREELLRGDRAGEREERAAQGEKRLKQSETWWVRKRWKDTLRDGEKRERWVLTGERVLSTDLPASNLAACGHHHSTGTHKRTHRCTVITHQHWPSVV